MSQKSYHIPQGNPCDKCGLPPHRHRVDHEQNGNPCKTCHDIAGVKHRSREREQERERLYIGIDGEGQGRSNHRYVMLAASTEDGSESWVIQGHRLSTVECLDMILKLPSRGAKIFSYSFNYDLTKMLEDVDNDTLYLLFRPELRPSPPNGKTKGPRPVFWKGYELNLQGTKFTVKRFGKRVVIWDLFKFFQSKFVSALQDWKVGNKDLWERMSKMKDKRSEFDKEDSKAILDYCLEECRCMAELAHKLVDAHETAELTLTNFYGAGSSGGAMLKKLGIRDLVRKPHEEMKLAVASAFSGGRFEHRLIGQVRGPVRNRDISSAYPYHTTFMPCLVHGSWRHTNIREKLDGRRAALVRYTLGSNDSITSWGPFPFRESDGTISYPIESGGGWVWLDEYTEAEKLFPHVEFREAFIYETECDCQPFEKIPEYYTLRLRIGKEGPGLVIKLGINSCYGKLAQSIGNALFNCWIWAGMITGGCRAQVLQMLGLHQNWDNLLGVATDGIFTKEKILAPIPRETGTDIEINGSRKPLGGWEEKVYENGLFFARPGIYFPLNPTIEDIKNIKGRGVGKGVVYENWEKIVDTWERDGIHGVARVANVTRFCGAKTSLSKSGMGVKRANASDGKQPSYGQWITRQVDMSFNPKPKRDGVNPDGGLTLRRFPRDMPSMPYKRAMISGEAQELMAATLEAIEQPDADLTEYELNEDNYGN